MRGRLACLALFAFAANAAHAHEFPERPITIIIGASQGGITDVATRLYADAAAKRLGQEIVIENRPTEAGTDAAAAVQNAKPDGYTLLAYSGAQLASLPALQPTPYEPVKGFAPVTTLFTLVNFLAVSNDCPANSVQELIALGRAKPGGLVFGSSGIGTTSHLTAAQMPHSTGTPVSIVHYAGAAPMIGDLIGGKLDFTFVSYTVARPLLEQKKLKLLAVDSDQRWRDHPDVPTLREAGIRQEKIASWFGLAAPAGTPDPILLALREAFFASSREEKVKSGLHEAGVTFRTNTPQGAKDLLAEEVGRTDALITAYRLRGEDKVQVSQH